MGLYLIDTNVISDYFMASMPLNGLQFMDNVIDDIPNLSVISQIELLCWKTDAAMERQIRNFLSDSIIFNITTTIIDNCVNIRRNKKVKTPDAIIAATAVAHGHILITNNEKYFININGLNIINPLKL